MWINEVVCKQNSAAFNVDFPRDTSSEHSAPSVKKRLEESLKVERVELTGEALAEKLLRAEEKRRMHLQKKMTSEMRLEAARERRQAQENVVPSQTERVRHRVSREAQVTENRRQRHEQQLQKLRSHIHRVEEVCREQAMRRQSSCERLAQKLDQRLDGAAQRREHSIQERKQVARQSYERKLYFDLPDHEQSSATVKMTIPSAEAKKE